MRIGRVNQGESGGARTLDPRLKRPLLYQLSYRFFERPQIYGFLPASRKFIFTIFGDFLVGLEGFMGLFV